MVACVIACRAIAKGAEHDEKRAHKTVAAQLEGRAVTRIQSDWDPTLPHTSRIGIPLCLTSRVRIPPCLTSRFGIPLCPTPAGFGSHSASPCILHEDGDGGGRCAGREVRAVHETTQHAARAFYARCARVLDEDQVGGTRRWQLGLRTHREVVHV